MTTDRATPWTVLLVVACAAAMVGVIYAPVGLSMMGLIEEWDIYNLFHRLGAFWITSSDSPLPTHRLRPLTVAPFTLAYVLGPQSFFTLNVLQIVALILKVLGFAAIVDWLTGSKRLALVCGLIFLLYPADTMQMTLRGVHINCALALTLLGVALVLDATTRPRATARALESACGGALFLTGSLIYEAGLFLAPLPLLVWWARFGFAAGWREIKPHLALVAIFAAFVAAAGLYFVGISLSGSSYQTGLTGDAGTIATNLAARIPLLVKIALYRLFVHGWYDSVYMLWARAAYWPWLPAAGAILAVAAMIPRAAVEPRIAVAARVAIAGLIAALLGYLPFLSSMAHIMTTQRTYLYAAAGATLIGTAVLIALACARLRIVGALAATGLIVLGLAAQWTQLKEYTALSNRQRMILAGILEAAPDAAQPGHKKLFIVDRSGTMTNDWMLRGFELFYSLSLLHGPYLEPVVCSAPADIYSTYQAGIEGYDGPFPTCVESDTDWLVGVGLKEPARFLKSDLLTLTIEPDLRVRAETPQAKPSADSAAQWRRFLGCWPAADCAVDILRNPTSRFAYEFGRWWGIDDVPWGSGFAQVQWDLPNWKPPGWAWIVSPKANLWFKITPARGPYVFHLNAFTAMSATTRDDMQFAINGTPLRGRWVANLIYEATFDGAILTPGLNEIQFTAIPDRRNGLSIAPDRIVIAPAQ